jgi:signal recognition particle subunit SRP68
VSQHDSLGWQSANIYLRCYYLARLHCIHPTPSYSSAVQLLSRASRLAQQSQHTLFDLSIPILESITPITPSTISTLTSQISSLDTASKRSLFAERVEKPVFFDTAFNYIDMPLDELLILAGKRERVESKSVAEEVRETVLKGVNAVARERTREATPGGEEVGTEKKGNVGKEEKPKGWLGGWFGRG